MSNRKHRDSQRANYRALESAVYICSECGERGFHWVSLPAILQNVMDETQPEGFWTCPNLYGPDGRRLEP